MGYMVDRGFVSRPAKTPQERLFVRREGPGKEWHARTADGELICKDTTCDYLQDWVTAEGFSCEMLEQH